MNSIIPKIKDKKELSDISDELVKDVLEIYLKKHSIIIPKKKKELKILIKEIRKELRKYVGRYQIKTDYKKRLELLEKNNIPDLLKTHTSTKERLDFYPELIKIINDLKPKSILDLGSGLNPIAIISYINNKAIVYHAIDIKRDELKLVEYFFTKNKIEGDVHLHDIRKIKNFPKTDLCLILKTLDIIDDKRHRISESIIKGLNSKHIIVSFSTRTLSGKPMNSPRRAWFENLLKELNYKYEIRGSHNEIFYVVEK